MKIRTSNPGRFGAAAVRAGACLVGLLAVAPACSSSKTQPIQDDPSTPWRESRLSLRPATSCETVRAHLVDVLTEQVLVSRYAPVGIPEADGVGAPSSPNVGDSGSPRAPTDYTKTNVQEEGVDEDDLVKTDGRFLYTVHGHELLILKSWPANETSIVARVSLGDEAWANSLFLLGDRVAVFSSVYESIPEPNAEQKTWSGTRVTFVDVADRTAPRVLAHREIEGGMSAARLIGSRLHLVTNGQLRVPDTFWSVVYQNGENYDFTADEEVRARRIERERPRVKALVERALAGVSVEGMLPRTRAIDAGGAVLSREAALVGCTELYLPAETSAIGLLAVSSFDLAAEAPANGGTTGVLANGWQVYASTNSLYVAMSSRWWWWGFGTQDNVSHLHKFVLDAGEERKPRYVGSGEVDGWILNQFSMSEYEGYLRVASTDNEWTWNEATQTGEVRGGNHVTVLQEAEGELRVVGSLRDLAPGEQIFAARMMGPKGYVVTFRQTDPLFTLDLSDPTQPRVVGELKIDGFSSYLHPVGANHLLAIGKDADPQGRVLGVHLQIFDVSDPANPTRAFHQRISTGSWSSWSEAMWDHHAFTYHPEKRILAFPASIYDWETRTGERFSGLLVYHASTEDGFREIGRVDHSDLVTRAYCERQFGAEACPPGAEYEWWASMRRSVFIEDALYSISTTGLKVNELQHPENLLATVPF